MDALLQILNTVLMILFIFIIYKFMSSIIKNNKLTEDLLKKMNEFLDKNK